MYTMTLNNKWLILHETEMHAIPGTIDDLSTKTAKTLSSIKGDGWLTASDANGEPHWARAHYTWKSMYKCYIQ